MDTKEAYQKLSLMCSRKEYCSFDMRKKMQLWKLTESQEQSIIDRLFEERYLSEERFTEAFVKDKFRFNKWGKQKIKFQLKQKQIPEEAIELALEQISEEDYIETMQELIASKVKSVKAKTEYERNGKLIRFMVQRGYGISEVNTILEQMKSDE